MGCIFCRFVFARGKICAVIVWFSVYTFTVHHWTKYGSQLCSSSQHSLSRYWGTLVFPLEIRRAMYIEKITHSSSVYIVSQVFTKRIYSTCNSTVVSLCLKCVIVVCTWQLFIGKVHINCIICDHCNSIILISYLSNAPLARLFLFSLVLYFIYHLITAFSSVDIGLQARGLGRGDCTPQELL